MVGGKPFLNILVRILRKGSLIKKIKEIARGKFLSELLHDVRMIAAARLVRMGGRTIVGEEISPDGGRRSVNGKGGPDSGRRIVD